MKTKAFLGILAAIGLIAVSASAQPTVTTSITNGLSEPYGVVVDANNSVYVSDSVNQRIVKLDGDSGLQSTFCGLTGVSGKVDGSATKARFNNPQGLAVATYNGTNGLLVADTGNHAIRFVSFANGSVITIAGQLGVAGGTTVAVPASATFNNPYGVAVDSAQNVYVADTFNNCVRVFNLGNLASPVVVLQPDNTSFVQPQGIAIKSASEIWVSDTRNNSVKLLSITGPGTATMTSLIGSDDSNYSGDFDSADGTMALLNQPVGLLWLGDSAGLLIVDQNNHKIKQAILNPDAGANIYSASTFAGTGKAGYLDGVTTVAQFNSPTSLAQDNLGGIQVADLKNNKVRRIQFFPAQPPVTTPQIGRIDLTTDPTTGSTITTFTAIVSQTFDNDITLGVLGENGTESLFTYGASPASPLQDTIPTPSLSNGSVPPAYTSGQSSLPASILDQIVRSADMTFKARGFGSERAPSGTATARLVFKVATPSVIGNNAASFSVTDNTSGAQIWYTTDGTIPTNASPSIGPVSSGTAISIPIGTSNITFIARAFKTAYQASASVTNIFSPTDFSANKITFGFDSGVASSDFVGSAGQTFYAPITLSLLSGAKMYGLQFNVSVTNDLAGVPAVTSGAIGFQSDFVETLPSGLLRTIPPAMWAGTVTLGVPDLNSLVSADTSSGKNLLLVGWFEVPGQTNLYNSPSHDLLDQSLAHDQLFKSTDGKVVVGGYSFTIPASATVGQQYRIQIGRPSAYAASVSTDVFIDTPTNGAQTAASPINAVKYVTVGQRKYLVGDASPFRWYNAGDFGDTNLLANDVIQVFRAAIYSIDVPPSTTDFFDAMDSSSGTTLLIASDGNDTTINSMSLGDGSLNVDDVYVTWRRSLDPTLTNYVRYWSGGVRVAEIYNGSVGRSGQANTPATKLTAKTTSSTSGPTPFVNFVASDATGTAGQTISVPITAQIQGSFPIRVLMLSLTVEPLDGSPALTDQIQFSPVPALGDPTSGFTYNASLSSYAAAWLNPAAAGITGTNLIGTLSIKIPAGASSAAAYRVVFNHASASPTGIALFPKTTNIGLVTLSDRSTSTFNDGIPDSWRLRYFGTVNNLLTQAGADADGDGLTNMAEYKAGTNPNDPSSNLKVNADTSGGMTLSWPSVSGKQYVVEYSTSLVSNDWTQISGVLNGTGGILTFTDPNAANGPRFYRVRLVDNTQ